MYEYRVTKYDPALRDERGAYTRDEWIMFRQIGESFGNIILTRGEYERVETNYVNAALAFLNEAGLSSLTVRSLENRRGEPLTFSEGSILKLEQVGDVIRRVFREDFWCRLESPDGFVHIGWDFYTFVGVRHPCPRAQAEAAEMGLYVEDFESPYKDDPE